LKAVKIGGGTSDQYKSSGILHDIVRLLFDLCLRRYVPFRDVRTLYYQSDGIASSCRLHKFQRQIASGASEPEIAGVYQIPVRSMQNQTDTSRNRVIYFVG